MEKLLIQTQRLLIRSLRETDIDDFFAYRSNPDVTKYQGFDVMTLEQAADFITTRKDDLFGNLGEWRQYGIELKQSKKLIGDCAIKLNEHDARISETGITISNWYQQQGYAKEALTGILHWLFKTKQLHRVVAIVDAENTASINLLKSLGYRQEGYFIENIWFKGKWGSEYQFAMLKREWEQLNNA